MRFGHFDDAAREYVIETPRTPYPWINYLGTEEFFGLVSHTGGGYCFYRDARLRRLTRYRYNNVPTDVGGRYFYVHDGGDYWTPGWAPVKRELDSYECRVGLSYTKITGERKGIRAEVLYFVPLGTTAEVHRVTPEEHVDGPEEREALLVRRVLPLGRGGRPEQLPAEPLDRRGGGRRLDDLPQDRVPRAPQPLRRPLGEREGRGLRHRPRELLRPLERLRRAAGRGGGEVAQLRGQRLVADRLAPAGGGPRPGRGEDLRLRPRLRREPGRGEVGEAGGRQQEAGARSCWLASRRRRRWTPPSPRSATTGRRCSRSTR